MSTKVFISYSHKDRAFVDCLAEDLKTFGVNVWLDKWEIKVGDSLTRKVSEGIHEAGYLAVVLSPQSVQSEWVQRELNAALMKELDLKRVFLLPILRESCKIPDIIRDKKWADFREDYDQGLRELLNRLASKGEQIPLDTTTPARRPPRRWNESTFFAKAEEKPEAARLLHRLYEWARRTFDIDWGTGAQIGSFMPSLAEGGGPPRLFWARTNGTVAIPFGQLPRDPSMEELESECRRRLKELGVDLWQKREPWFDVTHFSKEDVWAGFVQTMKWYAENYRKLKRQPAE